MKRSISKKAKDEEYKVLGSKWCWRRAHNRTCCHCEAAAIALNKRVFNWLQYCSINKQSARRNKRTRLRAEKDFCVPRAECKVWEGKWKCANIRTRPDLRKTVKVISSEMLSVCPPTSSETNVVSSGMWSGPQPLSLRQEATEGCSIIYCRKCETQAITTRVKKRGTQSSYHQTVREARICHDAPRHILRPAGLEFFIWVCRWVNTFDISHAANYWSAMLDMQAFDDLFSWLRGFPIQKRVSVKLFCFSMFIKWAYMASLTYVDIRNSW